VIDIEKIRNPKPGDLIPVIIDERGVQRFKENTCLSYMAEHDTHGRKIDPFDPQRMHTSMCNLNTLALAFHQGKFDKRDYMEIVMSGYSLSGFCDLSTFNDWSLLNPLWEPDCIEIGEGGRVTIVGLTGGQPEEEDEDEE
jgi:hypothetical protein